MSLTRVPLNALRMQLQEHLVGHNDMIRLCGQAHILICDDFTQLLDLRKVRALIELKLLLWQEPTKPLFDESVKTFLIGTRNALDARIYALTLGLDGNYTSLDGEPA